MNSTNELDLIRGILEKVDSSLTSEEILSLALQGIKDSFDCLAVAIILVDGRAGTFKVVNAKGWSNEFVKKFHSGPFEGLIREMAGATTSFIMTSEDERAGSPGYTFEHTFASLLAMPMGIRGKQVGFMYLSSGDPDGFAKDRETIIRDLANLCTLVLDHGSLGDKVLSLSNIDPMTGLYTFKFWHEELHREVQRAEKLDSKIALMDIRLNKFKEYNAMYGHLKGDEFLMAISDIIDGEVCSLDVPCRVGSKWHVLLVGEEEKAAREIAERIIEAKNRLPIPSDPPTTLSIGLSMYSAEGEKALISRVDDALMEARRQGGDACHVK
ncbi:MAG: sensor domain-containing diguanylate cyclase [bacterium]|nr:sensor domain-containing diguanylate cyclase [bacterium]MDT8395137.1 sensor domain-containing diguanylate cyclase [bacterium]